MSPDREPPVIGITLGDPLGIGPEIVAKAIAGLHDRDPAHLRVYGSWPLVVEWARVIGLDERRFVQCRTSADQRAVATGDAPSRTILVIDDDEWPADARWLLPGPRPTAEGGRTSFAWVERAIADALRAPGDPRRIDALVTAPISKTSWSLAGVKEFPGHTELLGARAGTPGRPHGMLFVGPHLRVMLATIHTPLAKVSAALSVRGVREAIELAHESCVGLGAVRAATGMPRIAVCGVNPHAGEGGILGVEDDAVIRPAVEQALKAGIDAVGPLPGDTIFKAAAAPPFGSGSFDCVVAMYHDQGLIPIKLIDGERAINVTVGLGIIRTSPAHGTAFDIAGTNMASATSMIASIELAASMAGRARRENRGPASGT